MRSFFGVVPFGLSVMCCASPLLVIGCAHNQSVSTEPALPLPTSEEAVATHNTRVARLDRLWARAVVTLRFTNEKGDKKWEQGNGHFQLRDGSKLALSIGKLGEVLLWIGADEERYWAFNKLEEPVAYTGRHDEITPRRLQRSGLPVPPLELLRLGGLQSIDPDGALVDRTSESRIVVTTEDAGGSWQYVFEAAPENDLPIEVRRRNLFGELVLTASLESPKTVRVQDELGFPPRTFSRLLVTHIPTGDSISLLLDGEIIDGRRTGKPSKAVFDFEVLKDAYGPFERVVDLDVIE